MAISGGIKFFSRSKTLEQFGASVAASTGTASQEYCLDNNRYTSWQSAGSNDSTTETLTIDFYESTTIDRILLLSHNWKEYTIQYNLASVWTHFASVVGLDGAQANISETDFADDSSYYEFTPVTTTQIRIQIVKTQTADQEKYINQVIATEEIGTFTGYPEISKVETDRNAKVKQTLSGRFVVQKSVETFAIDLKFKNYPSSSTYNGDMDILMELQDLEIPFLVWLCGGRRGETYFRYTLRGFRLQDVFQMQITKAIGLSYMDNIYTNPVSAAARFEEAV